jgi:cytochrome P450
MAPAAELPMTDPIAASLAVPTPGHVDPAAVVDFDMYRDPELLSDPHARIARLAREAPPVFWTPRNGGHWIFQSHGAVFDAARDTDAFSSEFIPHAAMQAMLSMRPAGSPHVPVPYPILLDPPLHQKYRQPLQAVFSPKTVMGLQDDIRALAGGLLDAAATGDGCEFMAAVAEPLPVQIFLKMLGLPQHMMPAYRALLKEHLAQQTDSSPAEAMQRLIKVAAVMREEVLDRRDNPRDDVISLLWSLEIDGKPTTLEDLENYCVLLFIAGLDTVVNGMGYAARHLALDPELQDRLRADPSLIPEAAEEMLRRYTFVAAIRRVKRDVEFKGLCLKENEKVILYLPGADLDPEVFSQPDEFSLGRENKAHIAFNAGPHRCLGSHLARLELHILYEEMLARLPRFRLDPAHDVKFVCSQIIGIEELHLTWDR